MMIWPKTSAWKNTRKSWRTHVPRKPNNQDFLRTISDGTRGIYLLTRNGRGTGFAEQSPGERSETTIRPAYVFTCIWHQRYVSTATIFNLRQDRNCMQSPTTLCSFLFCFLFCLFVCFRGRGRDASHLTALGFLNFQILFFLHRSCFTSSRSCSCLSKTLLYFQRCSSLVSTLLYPPGIVARSGKASSLSITG